jgi:hypothetical protein
MLYRYSVTKPQETNTDIGDNEFGALPEVESGKPNTTSAFSKPHFDPLG